MINSKEHLKKKKKKRSSDRDAIYNTFLCSDASIYRVVEFSVASELVSNIGC